jgi:hypothetical protein
VRTQALSIKANDFAGNNRLAGAASISGQYGSWDVPVHTAASEEIYQLTCHTAAMDVIRALVHASSRASTIRRADWRCDVMTETEINTVGNVLIAKLQDLGVRQKCIIAGKAGLEIGEVPSTQQNIFVDSSIRKGFAALDTRRKLNALPVLAEQLIAASGAAGDSELPRLLEQHGFQYNAGKFIPIGLLDEREARHLPASSASELANAVNRLASGKDSAAITSACGAVDLATSAAYEKYNLGALPNSFQARVNVVMDKLNIYEEIKQELVEIKIKPHDAETIVKEMHETIKHAANALEVIRRTQADAHGTKPAYRRTAYDAIKWASAICGLLESKV